MSETVKPTPWLWRETAKLAAELLDDVGEIDLDDSIIEVELRVTRVYIEGAPPHHISFKDEYVRRVKSNFGEWAATESVKREGWA